MVKQKKGYNYNLISILLALVCLIAPMLNFTMPVSAAESTYTSVLEDLQRDNSFDISKYPENEKDFSMSLIQLAESSDQELFVYVYQPAVSVKKLIATTIRMSTTEKTTHWTDYKLRLVSLEGTLQKYVVCDFKVSISEIRYYDIVCFHRNWDSSIDPDPGNDNTTNEQVVEVSRRWVFYTEDGELKSDYEGTDVVTITDKLVGYVRYQTPNNWLGRACDSFFVAFSTNYNIDSLRDVDIEWQYRTYLKTTKKDTIGINPGGNMGTEIPGVSEGNTTYSYGDWQKGSKTVYSHIEKEIAVGLLFKKIYKINEIETSSYFLSDKKNMGISQSVWNYIEKSQWVLNFFSADFRNWSDAIGVVSTADYESGMRVSSVTLLRLKFDVNGKGYNLGVVDNKQQGSDNPINSTKKKGWPWWVYLIIAILSMPVILFVFYILSLIMPFLKPVVDFFVCVIKGILEGLWWLLTLPYQLIKKRKE